MPANEPRPDEPGDSSARRSANRRNEKPAPNNAIWYVLIFGLIAMVIWATTQYSVQATQLTYSEFVSKLTSNEYHAGNVHELTISPLMITFRDQPAPKAGDKIETPRVRVKAYSVPSIGIGDTVQAELLKLLSEKKIDYNFGGDSLEWQRYLAYVGTLVLSVVLMFILARRVFGPGTAMSFGRSRGRLFAQEELGINFNDIAGIDEAVEELKEIVEFLRNPGKYQALGGRIPRGVLLVGPPGTGKTLLAKAVAGEANVPFFSLSGSDFVELYVGVGAARVRDMFQQAMSRSPSIIFIDELDALGKVRGSGMPGGHDERDQTLNALLVEMDGFASDQSVIVMGATNRPETLDPALMRPGRFDRHVLVDRPDIRGREAILRVHAKKVKLDDSVDLKHVARLTPGFVGADLANIVNEGALLAARRNKTSVSMDEMEEGIERVVAGLEKQTRIIGEDTKQRVAYHEVGHALVACVLPNVDPVHKVSIIPRGLSALGYTLQRPEEDRQLITKTELQNRICVLLGGIAAEDIIYQENSTGGSNDLQRATDLARRMVTEFGMSPKLGRVHYSEGSRSAFLGTMMPGSGETQHAEETVREIDLEVRRIIDTAYASAHEILASRRPIVEHLTRELLEREVMDAAQIQAVLVQYQTGPQLKPGTFQVVPPPAPAVPPSLNSVPTSEAAQSSGTDEPHGLAPGTSTAG